MATKQANLFSFYKKAILSVVEGEDGKDIFQHSDEGGNICSIHPEKVNSWSEAQEKFNKIYHRVCEKLGVASKHEEVGRPTIRADRCRAAASKIATKILSDKSSKSDSDLSSGESSQSSTHSSSTYTDDELIEAELKSGLYNTGPDLRPCDRCVCLSNVYYIF